MKVVGRDVWIGIWAFVLAIVATTYWEKKARLGRKANAAEIWWRFSEIRLSGFFAAVADRNVGHAAIMQWPISIRS